MAQTNAAISSGNYDIVFGGGDAEVLALSYGRDSLDALVPYPPHDRLTRAFDKLDLVHAARRAGIPTPMTLEATPDTLAAFDLPMVVKARTHWRPGMNRGPRRMPTVVCSTRAEACLRVAEIVSAGGLPILQSRVVGQLMGVIVVAQEGGHPVVVLQQVAERVWPPNAGDTARGRTVAVDQELAVKLQGLLSDLGWMGLAQLEFLLPEKGLAELTDFNGRFYGSMALASGAGVNLPAIWADLYLHGTTNKVREPRTGIRYQWLEGDLRRAFAERQSGLLPDVLDCFRYANGAVPSIGCRKDPLPAVRYAPTLALRGLKKAFTFTLAR